MGLPFTTKTGCSIFVTDMLGSDDTILSLRMQQKGDGRTAMVQLSPSDLDQLRAALAPEVEGGVSVRLTLTEANPRRLSLRTLMASGTTNDGTEFEVASSNSGISLSMGSFGSEDRIVHDLSITDLALAWLAAIGKPQ